MDFAFLRGSKIFTRVLSLHIDFQKNNVEASWNKYRCQNAFLHFASFVQNCSFFMLLHTKMPHFGENVFQKENWIFCQNIKGTVFMPKTMMVLDMKTDEQEMFCSYFHGETVGRPLVR